MLSFKKYIISQFVWVFFVSISIKKPSLLIHDCLQERSIGLLSVNIFLPVVSIQKKHFSRDDFSSEWYSDVGVFFVAIHGLAGDMIQYLSERRKTIVVQKNASSFSTDMLGFLPIR